MSARDVRKPPIGAVLRQHKQGVRGLCGWCGLSVEEKTEVRGWFKFWHAACQFEMGIIENPANARDAVFNRDKGVCCDCGEDFSERYAFRAGGIIRMWGEWDNERENRSRYAAERQADFHIYTEVVWISLWHVDHKTPLWKVRHLPDLERLEFFKLANLITRCHRCHERKTSEEAAERAKFNRLATPKSEKPKRIWPKGKKLQSRGFEKCHRPMRPRRK
jgi:5-methylcytosine-specific restriction endonuclease McrA